MFFQLLSLILPEQVYLRLGSREPLPPPIPQHHACRYEAILSQDQCGNECSSPLAIRILMTENVRFMTIEPVPAGGGCPGVFPRLTVPSLYYRTIPRYSKEINPPPRHTSGALLFRQNVNISIASRLYRTTIEISTDGMNGTTSPSLSFLSELP
jgi:hypothetical protein